jgi:hypothetical protein
MMIPESLRAEELARLFHEAYERLAPSFGYETHPDSAVPWESVPESNRNLMVAVAAEILPAVAKPYEGAIARADALEAPLRARLETLRSAWVAAADRRDIAEARVEALEAEIAHLRVARGGDDGDVPDDAYKAARGVAPAPPGSPSPEEAVRRIRGGA